LSANEKEGAWCVVVQSEREGAWCGGGEVLFELVVGGGNVLVRVTMLLILLSR